jgi:hypothetical protein
MLKGAYTLGRGAMKAVPKSSNFLKRKSKQNDKEESEEGLSNITNNTSSNTSEPPTIINDGSTSNQLVCPPNKPYFELPDKPGLGELIKYIIANLLKLLLIPFKVIWKILEYVLFAINKLKPRKKYFKALHATNVFPGLLSLILMILLIIFLIWTLLQKFLRWISFGNIELPNLPILYNRKITQIIYSFFYLLTSAYLLFYLFVDNFKILKEQLTNNTESSNLDIIEILKRLVGTFYILWPIFIVVIGSTITKAFYKMSCNGAETNIYSFAKIVDSSVLAVLVISIIFIILLKITSLLEIIIKRVKPDEKEKVGKAYKTMFGIIFNFNLSYIILRLITLMFEEFAAKSLVFLISKLSNQVANPIINNCNETESECEKSKDDELEKFMQTVIGTILWFILFIVVIIQAPLPPWPIPALAKIKPKVDFPIGNVVKILFNKLINMVTSSKNKTSNSYDTDTDNVSASIAAVISASTDSSLTKASGSNPKTDTNNNISSPVAAVITSALAPTSTPSAPVAAVITSAPVAPAPVAAAPIASAAPPSASAPVAAAPVAPAPVAPAAKATQRQAPILLSPTPPPTPSSSAPSRSGLQKLQRTLGPPPSAELRAQQRARVPTPRKVNNTAIPDYI